MYGTYYGNCGGCYCEPITKEEKVALIERKEKMLKERLEYLAKIKESLAAETEDTKNK